jgi:hypothetical protein
VKKAFTLIELLTIMVIIAILVSLLLASLNWATIVSKRSKCAYVMRHFDQARMIYWDNTEFGKIYDPLSENQTQEFLKDLKGARACPGDIRLKMPVYSGADLFSYFFNAEGLDAITGYRSPYPNLHVKMIGLAGVYGGSFHPYKIAKSFENTDKEFWVNFLKLENNSKNNVMFWDGSLEFIPIYYDEEEGISFLYEPPSNYRYRWGLKLK